MSKPSVAELIASFDCEQTAVRAVRFTPDFAYCLTAGCDKTVRLWNPNRQLLLQEFVGHNQEVLDARGSPDNSNVVSGGSDRYVYVWDVLKGRPVRHFRTHMGPVQCVAYNADGTVMASGSLDCRVHLYDLRAHGREPLQTLPEAKDSVHAICMNERQIMTGSLDGRLRTYDLRVGQMYDDFVGAGVLAFVESQDKQCVLVSCMDGCVRLIDKQNGQVLSEYRGHAAGKYKLDCAFVKNDSVVVCGSEDGKVHAWQLLDNQQVGQLTHAGRRVAHSLCSDHQSLLLSAAESHVYVWSLNNLTS